MRPRIEGSIGDDAMLSCGYLKYQDESLSSSILQSLNTMRRHKLFCDVILHAESVEFHCHRNVLAGVSPYLLDLFSSDKEATNGVASEGHLPTFVLNGLITKDGLQYLVDYAYTGNLEVPDELIKDVYLAAWKLKMDNVIKETANHLIKDLEAETCIEIRSLPGISRNKSFVQAVDSFILKEFSDVTKAQSFLQLPSVQIEVLYQTKQEMSIVADNSLCRLIVDWIRRQMTDESLTMELLMERSHLLYLALDNSLQDCSDLPPGEESESDIVQDYKRLVLKTTNNNKTSRRKCLSKPSRPRVILYSRDIFEREGNSHNDLDWSLIASSKVADHTFVSLITLNGNLSRLSVQLRLNNPQSKTPSPITTPDMVAIAASPKELEEAEEIIEMPELFCEVATMSGPKCGLGVAELQGKLLVCGGYDRAECLKSVESYCPETNTWTQGSSMGEARGRVQIAVINETVYAVGGSNGTTELDTVECLKMSETKWKKCCKLPMARSNAGVCALKDKIFCIGGWNGQIGIKQCDVFVPEENNWTSIAPLNTGRYQAGVASYRGRLWAVGGSDAWSCLGSTEVYDLDYNQWRFKAPLLTPRRGCGLAEFNNKLYAVGGSDGTHSLNSTEIFDEATKSWVVGPNLTTPRSNVSVVAVQDRLYAIGGFSGKTFLNTIEYLDSQTNEWTTFVPQTNQTIDNLMEKQRGAVGEEIVSDKVFKPIKRAELNGYHSDSKEETDEEVKSIMESKKKSVNGYGYKKDKKIKDDLTENGTNVVRSIKVDKLQKIIENNYTEIADNTNS